MVKYSKIGNVDDSAILWLSKKILRGFACEWIANVRNKSPLRY